MRKVRSCVPKCTMFIGSRLIASQVLCVGRRPQVCCDPVLCFVLQVLLTFRRVLDRKTPQKADSAPKRQSGPDCSSARFGQFNSLLLNSGCRLRLWFQG